MRDQSIGEYAGRAPEGRGIWAFPFPYNDDFFNWHKWEQVLPKHLTRGNIAARDAALTAAGASDADAETVMIALHAERETWIKEHGGLMPLRKFWWQGDVWARFDRGGHHSERGMPAWHLLDMDAYEKAARRAEPHGYWTHDHMEIFLATARGKVIGGRD